MTINNIVACALYGIVVVMAVRGAFVYTGWEHLEAAGSAAGLLFLAQHFDNRGGRAP